MVFRKTEQIKNIDGKKFSENLFKDKISKKIFEKNFKENGSTVSTISNKIKSNSFKL